jgi:GDPmannose 4,6-dehydratase
VTNPSNTLHEAALVTGITGQDGRFLAQFLTSKGYQVFGSLRRTTRRARCVDETPCRARGDARLSSLMPVEQVQPDEVTTRHRS